MRHRLWQALGDAGLRKLWQALGDAGLRKLLAHPARLQILALLSSEPLTARELSQEIGISLRSTHYHLARLRDHGEIDLVIARGASGPAKHCYCPSERARGLGLALRELIVYANRPTGVPDTVIGMLRRLVAKLRERSQREGIRK